jgi:DNA-directed RNA polymerase specialized sigma24 family protein
VLHHYLGLSVPEAADALGIQLGTAKSRSSRTIDAMRASVEAAPAVDRSDTARRFA